MPYNPTIEELISLFPFPLLYLAMSSQFLTGYNIEKIYNSTDIQLRQKQRNYEII